HLEVDAELAAIGDRHLFPGRVDVEYRGYIVLGVAGGKQHAGDGEDLLHAGGAQPIQPLVNHRVGKFEIAVFDRHARQALAQPLAQHGEFADGQLVTTAVTTEHDARTGGHDEGFFHWSRLSKTRERQSSQRVLKPLRTWSPSWVDR